MPDASGHPCLAPIQVTIQVDAGMQSKLHSHRQETKDAFKLAFIVCYFLILFRIICMLPDEVFPLNRPVLVLFLLCELCTLLLLPDFHEVKEEMFQTDLETRAPERTHTGLQRHRQAWELDAMAS